MIGSRPSTTCKKADFALKHFTIDMLASNVSFTTVRYLKLKTRLSTNDITKG